MWTIIKLRGGIRSRIKNESLTLKVLLVESRTLLHSSRFLAAKKRATKVSNDNLLID